MSLDAGTDLLRLPWDQVREIQSRNLREQVALCARGHPFYRERFRAAGIRPDDIRTIDDLPRLPVTHKLDFAADPEAFRLDLPDLPLDQRMIWEVMYTTGTTSGQPAIVYTTTYDHYGFLVQTARASELSGFTPDDRLANLLPLAPWPMGAFLRTHHHAAAIGMAIANAHTGRRHPKFPVHRSLDDAIELVERHRATILFGVGGFVRRLLLRAQEVGADFSSVRHCAITGEQSSTATRADLRARLRELGARDVVINDRYGSTEMGMMTQCREDGPFHNPAPEFVALEVVDQETFEPLPDGERGLLVFTHLNRRGTVMLRYAVGDVVALDRRPCDHCGRTAERLIGPPVRTKEFTKLKGMLINPAILKEEVAGTAGIDDYQLVFTKEYPDDQESMDRLVVRVAADDARREVIREELTRRVRAAVGVSPVVEFAARDDIYDPERREKPQRIVDLRPAPTADDPA